MTTATHLLNALLMSSSRQGRQGYLEHATDQLHALLQGQVKRITFVPYAAVSFGYDEYEARVAAVFQRLGVAVRSLHHEPQPLAAVRDAEALVVGGGNTFALLHRLYAAGLVSAMAERARAGLPYVGWSAGANVACPSIRTTNDMPIVQPPSMAALGLLPFQINPHFIPGKPPGHNGESREERLAEFLAINPGEELLALPEGTALLCRGGQAQVLGEQAALWFRQAGAPVALPSGTAFALDVIAPGRDWVGAAIHLGAEPTPPPR